MPKGIYKRTEKEKARSRKLAKENGFKKGHPNYNLSGKGQFKTNSIPWMKGRKGKKCPNWKGGEYVGNNGYIHILKSAHPFCNRGGYVRRSRLVMEETLGRYLTKKEIVHHEGIRFPISSIKNKQDDRPENLRLFPSKKAHQKFHYKIRPKNEISRFV